MLTVFTKTELEAKGITKKHVQRMLASTEKLCNWYASRHIKKTITTEQEILWTNACMRWDHLKATLSVLS